MGLETGTYISDLNVANPTAADPKSNGDDHLRLLKYTLKMTFPNITGAITATHTQLNYVTGVTSSIQGQFAAVQGQFTGVAASFADVQTELDTKGNLLGATWYGPQNFMGAAVTVANPTLPNHAVNLFTLQQQAFSTVVPDQAGNAGRYLGTDGTNTSWRDLSGGVTTTTSAVSIQLTVASRQLQVVTMTADDQSVILPDATTISAGGRVFTVYNKGTKAITGRNKDMTFLVSILPGQIASFYCYDKTTAAGFWFVGNESYTGGSLSDHAEATIAVLNAIASSETGIARMNDTQVVCAYRGQSGYLQAVCLTITEASIFAGPILPPINAENTNLVSVAMMSATKVVVSFVGTSSYPKAVVLTLAGNVLTPGTVRQINAVASASGVSVTALSSTQAFMAYCGTGSQIETTLLDIPATTITPSVTPLVVNAGVASGRPAVAALTATKVLLVYLGASSYSNNVVIDISGATMTPGLITPFTANNGQRTALVALSSSRALYGCQPSSLNVFVLDVTAGTTVTPSAVATGESGVTGAQLGFAVLSPTRIICAYSGVSNVRAALVTIDGAVPSVGANFMPTQAAVSVSTVGLTSTKAILLFGGVSSYLSAQIIEKAE